jgi:predicted ATPase
VRVASSGGIGLTKLIGRERELQALGARLGAGARLITLLGPGGSGKTRLARAVYDHHTAERTEAYFVDLVGVNDPDLVPASIASALGVSETPELDAAAAATAALQATSATISKRSLALGTSWRISSARPPAFR